MMCENCLYCGMGCGNEDVSECEYYYSMDEEEIEIEIAAKELRDEFYDDWIEYVSEYSDFNFDLQHN